jgi:two-component system response regulator (stage 0 sporulation protein F)
MEDDESIRLALRKYLSRTGHEVLEASNGAEGAAIYNETPPDLIITDILVPDQDGVEALLDLRQNLTDVKIIVISGNAQEFLPIARDLGAHKTFAKPFQQAEILEAVTRTPRRIAF